MGNKKLYRKELKTTVSRQQQPVTLPSGHIKDNEVMTCPLAIKEIRDTSLQLETTALRNGHDSLHLQPHVQALSETILETIYKLQNGSEQQIKKKAKSLEPFPHTLASGQGMMCDVNCTPKTKVSSSDFVFVGRVFEQQHTTWAPWHKNHGSSLQRTLPCPVSHAQQRECHRYQQQLRSAWGETKTQTCISNKRHPERRPGSEGLLRPSILQNSQQQTLHSQAPHYWNQPVLPFWSLHQGGGAWMQQLHSAPVCSGRQELQPASTYHAFASTTDHGSQFHQLQALNNSCPYYNCEPFLFCNGYPFGMSNSQIPAVDSQQLRTFYSDPNCSAASQPPPVYWN
nr:PREDICTED: uncharacterized protein LOC107075611 isoform X2 [Lepisosteus oculatus]